MNWAQALTAIDRCREAGDRAQDPKFKDYWYGVAQKLGDKYLMAQPWLRTYDGKLK
jgi:hypothetical protein